MNKIKKFVLPLLALTTIAGLNGSVRNVDTGVAGAIKTAGYNKGGIKRAYTNTNSYDLNLNSDSFISRFPESDSTDLSSLNAYIFYTYKTADKAYAWESRGGTYDTNLSKQVTSALSASPNALAYAVRFPNNHVQWSSTQSGTQVINQKEMIPTKEDVIASDRVAQNTAGDLQYYIFTKAEMEALKYVSDDTFNVSCQNTLRDVLATSKGITTTTSDAYVDQYLFGMQIAPLYLPGGGEPEPTEIVSGRVKHVAYYVPSVPTIETILSNIDSKDLFGVTATVSVSETEKAKYTGKLGSYDLTVNGADSNGKTATATLNINILDNIKPTVKLVSGKSLTFTAGRDTLNIEDLKNFFEITDNGTEYGGTMYYPTYFYDGVTFPSTIKFTDNDIGTHKIKIIASDSSGNSSITEFSLSVLDGTAPIITKIDGSTLDVAVKMNVSQSYDYKEKDFLALFKATDNKEGNISSRIAVKGDFISHKIGKYPISLTCSDQAGNKATVTAYIEVVKDLPPVHILSDDLVLVDKNEALTIADLTSIVSDGILSNQEVVNCTVDGTSYLGNEKKAGDYSLTYKAEIKKTTSEIETLNGTFVLRVVDNAIEEDDDKPWYSFFTEFLQRIGNWFRGIFTKFKFDCFITNEEWELRFEE